MDWGTSWTAPPEFNTPLLLATMIAIMVVGIGVELLFTLVDRRIRARRGLTVGGLSAT